MCEWWCDKDEIKDVEEYEKAYSLERTNHIVYNKNTKQYHIWVECEDWYYSGIQFHNIKFCPYCGRKLN